MCSCWATARPLWNSCALSFSPLAFSSHTRPPVTGAGVSPVTRIMSASVLPHFVLRYRQMPPEVARDALVATQGGRSVARCAVLYPMSPLALYRLLCAFGHQSLGSVLTRCGLPLPVYFLADDKHSRCPTAKVSLPTIVCGRVL